MTDDRDRSDPQRPDPFNLGAELFARRIERRQSRIRAEIEANRRGEYRVPTWVLTLALVAMIAAIAAVMVLR